MLNKRQSEKREAEGQKVGAESLAAFFERIPRFALAFSGGCDSSYVLAAACVAGCEVGVYYVKTAFQMPFELDDARCVLESLPQILQKQMQGRTAPPFQIPSLRVLELDILEREEVCRNAPDRCYRCKRFILGAVQAAAKADGFEVLVDGTNASDDPARRPGFRALDELGVISVLRRAGMGKEEIRAASRELGLITADKPNFSCLATEVPEGEALTLASLAQVAQRRGVACGKRPWELPR